MGEDQGLGVIEVTYSIGDLFAINLRAWRIYLRWLVISELVFIGIIIVFPRDYSPTWLDALRDVDWWFPLGFGVILLAFWFGVCPLIGYLRSKRRRVLGPNGFSLSVRGVDVRTPDTESLVYWSGIKRVLRTKQRLYLFMTPASALIMPRRAFATNESFDAWGTHSQNMWSKAKSDAAK